MKITLRNVRIILSLSSQMFYSYFFIVFSIFILPSYADEFDVIDSSTVSSKDISSFMVVDCLLPGQVRQLGSMRYIAARKAIKTSTSDCEVRGGEYVAYDRADMGSSLKIWLPLAEEGDSKAQNYVGEIYEKGQANEPDYASAAMWYFKSAEQGFSRAAINLGQLFEKGLGLDQDAEMARFWYQKASGIEGLTFSASKANTGAKISTAKPIITIIEPELQQNSEQFYTTWEGGKLLVIGEIKNGVEINEVKINGQKVKLVGGSLFRGKILPTRSSQPVIVEAKNKQGKISRFTFNLTRPEVRQKENKKPAQVIKKYGLAEHQLTLGKGKYYALIVGNNRYTKVPELETAVNDAKTLNQLLIKEYKFTTKLLIDADRYTILSELNKLGKDLKPEDKMLLYYAGHGELDRVNKRGHWLPIDAEADSTANWIPNISITDMLNTLESRQLMVIADSCYSGMMSRSVLGIVDPSLDTSKRSNMLQSMIDAKTRTGLSSGGVTPVIDSLDGNHSIFAVSLLDILRKNTGAITGFEIFEKVFADVKKSSEAVGFEQIPEYAPLKYAGHEAGDFIFIKQ